MAPPSNDTSSGTGTSTGRGSSTGTGASTGRGSNNNAGTGTSTGRGSNNSSGTNNANRNNNNRNRGNNARSSTRSDKPKFEGLCEGLQGHIYDCSNPKDSTSFEKTTEVIAEYVNREYKNGSYLRMAIVNERDTAPKPPMPTDPEEDAGATAKEIWKQKVALYVKDRGQHRFARAQSLLPCARSVH